MERPIAVLREEVVVVAGCSGACGARAVILNIGPFFPPRFFAHISSVVRKFFFFF